MLRFLIPLLILSQNPTTNSARDQTKTFSLDKVIEVETQKEKVEKSFSLEEVIKEEKNIYEDVVYVRGNPIKIEINDAEKYFKANTQDEDLARKALFTAKVKKDYENILNTIIEFDNLVENRIGYLVRISLDIPKIIESKAHSFLKGSRKFDLFGNLKLKEAILLKPDPITEALLDVAKQLELMKRANYGDINALEEIVEKPYKEEQRKLMKEYQKEKTLEEISRNERDLAETLIRKHMNEMASDLAFKLYKKPPDGAIGIGVAKYIPSYGDDYRRLLAFIDPSYVRACTGKAVIIALSKYGQINKINPDKFSLKDAIKIYNMKELIEVLYWAKDELIEFSKKDNLWYDIVNSKDINVWATDYDLDKAIKKGERGIKELPAAFLSIYSNYSSAPTPEIPVQVRSLFLKLPYKYFLIVSEFYWEDIVSWKKPDLFISNSKGKIEEIINSYNFIPLEK